MCIKPLGTCRGWGSSGTVGLLSTPTDARRAARLNVFFGGRGRSSSAPPHGIAVGRGAVSLAGVEGGDLLEGTGWRVPGTAVGGSDSGRSLLADHLSYGARWANPPFARGAPSGGF
ncbi:unnamed protein product [Pleuronectes platessa]|uniref:Uncharacterized protein n=1 Tax=Pleuronectes platessa TaxID=8262 RepID=A0A9N7YCQ6_PLEPL|nr:unnamed protein product [Pleuronectes platessa]